MNLLKSFETEQTRLSTGPGQRATVGVLLSGGEKFSPYFGGALARWSYEVYRRTQDVFDAKVFGFPTKSQDLYPFPHASSRAATVHKCLASIPVARRHADLIWLRSLAHELRKCDILHVHNRPQWMHCLRRLGFRGKLVLHLQNDHLGHWTVEMLEQLAPQLDLLLVCSAYLRDTFANRCDAIGKKTHVLFNGVDTRRFFPSSERKDPATIFFVGRFHQEKGILQLVRAFGQVLKSHPQAKLIIGGTTGFGVHQITPYVQQVYEEAGKIIANGGQIEFTGYIHHDKELCSWFQQATIFACPSLFQEPFGLVNAEAMACATPVIGAARGGIPEVIGNCGILVNPENTNELAGALIRLLDSPPLRAALGQAAYERCLQNFDWSVVAERLVELLDTIEPRVVNRRN